MYNDVVNETLLQTKLHIPPLRSSIVPRSRLTAKLNAGLDGRFTLISAPAGYGKTTLVAEWLSQKVEGERMRDEIIPPPAFNLHPFQVTWFSLDEADNDPRRFLAYLLAALQKVQVGIGQTAEALLQSPQPPPDEAILTALVNEITASSQSFILVLDDYHVIQAPPIHRQLNFLLSNQPSQMHLVVVTREDPPLPLARLRARGQMVEIRQQDLRFSLDECTGFLNQVMGLDLSPTDISALERRTEGWIAGLQLAALSMRGRDDLRGFIEAFTGSSHFVLDYLIEEVFARQSAEVQDFLLKTSILERLCAPLCDSVISNSISANGEENPHTSSTKHVLQLPDTQTILEYLERSNLFIVPLDQSHVWYRYHRLFAELLRQRLRITATISESALHHIACQWFVNEGLLAEAIQHALAGSDWDRAAELISGNSESMLRRGELMTLLGWFKALPDDVIRKHPQLCRDYGWALTLAGKLDTAAPYLECAEQSLQGDDEHLGQVLVAQAYLARTRGEFPQAIALSKRALALIAESDILSRGLVTFTLGFSLLNTGHLAEAEPMLLEACKAARLSGNDYARLTALGLLGAIQRNQGRLHRATEFYRQALQEAQGSPAAAQVHAFLAVILYEWNDLVAAADQLVRALKASQHIGNRAIQVDVYAAMARLKQAQGDPSAALDTLRELHQVVQESDSFLSRASAAAYHAEIAIAQGDIPTASRWAQQMMEKVDPAALGVQLQCSLTRAQLLLAQGKKTEAGKLLAGLYETVSQVGFVPAMIEVRALQAMAASSTTDAFNFLAEAMEKAQPEGFIRTFLDKGEPMKFLLERLKSEGGEIKEYILTVLSAFGEKGRAAVSQLLVEPMSERELEILRLLADGLSNREIAERLVISVGTTKSHVHHILEKVGGNSRMQAVAKARELGLL